MLIRSWNLFHGNTDPPRRRGFLRRMVELAGADRPAVLCLQEVPVWALPRIDNWSGMQRFSTITRAPLWPGPLSAWITRAHQGFFRSGLAGQANVILVAAELAAESLGAQQISTPGKERRMVEVVRVAGVGLVANLHATNDFRDPAVPLAELERARTFVERLARPDEPIVLAGDFNVTPVSVGEGYTAPGPGIDHIVVRGRSATPLSSWPRERRTSDGRVFSDHPPVELVLDSR